LIDEDNQSCLWLAFSDLGKGAVIELLGVFGYCKGHRRLLGSAYNDDWSDFVCVDVDGHIIRPEYLSRTFPKFLEKHGLSKIKFRELRDSNASILLDKNVNMRLIQGWLGHANIKTTVGYTHLKVGSKRKVLDALSLELAGK